MNNPGIRFDEMLAKLKGQQCRITPQRLAILRILSTSENHPSAEDIYGKVKEDFPTTSLATVYKTLTLLKELGEVLELEFSDRQNRYDGNTSFSHPHVICTQCDRILDLDLPALQELSREVARKTGYEILDQRLDFYAVCTECREK